MPALTHSLVQCRRLLDFGSRYVRVLAAFEEARTLLLAYELDERWRVRLPVSGEPFKLLEYGNEASACRLAAIVSSIRLPYARISPSVPGLIFATIEKPWHAGVRGYVGPYHTCSSMK